MVCFYTRFDEWEEWRKRKCQKCIHVLWRIFIISRSCNNRRESVSKYVDMFWFHVKRYHSVWSRFTEFHVHCTCNAIPWNDNVHAFPESRMISMSQLSQHRYQTSSLSLTNCISNAIFAPGTDRNWIVNDECTLRDKKR